jgi:hypothetical protein
MYYTTGIDEQDLGYYCCTDCMNRHLPEVNRVGERMKMHVGKGDPELCDSLLCDREAV